MGLALLAAVSDLVLGAAVDTPPVGVVVETPVPGVLASAVVLGAKARFALGAGAGAGLGIMFGANVTLLGATVCCGMDTVVLPKFTGLPLTPLSMPSFILRRVISCICIGSSH